MDELRIGATPLAAYDEVEIEWGDAQGRMALVASNVDSEAGADLIDTEWHARTTKAGTRRIGIDLAARIFRVFDRGDGGQPAGFIGGAVAAAVLEARVRENNGLIEHAVTVEIEIVAADGTVERHSVTLSNDQPDVIRRTLAYDVTPGTYTVRVRRRTGKSGNSRITAT